MWVHSLAHSVGSGSGIATSYCNRYVLDPVLLWLRDRPVAAAPFGPLAWELPYVTGVALKRKNSFTKEHLKN